jgi:hypothetical protein
MTEHTFTHPDEAPEDHPGYMTRGGCGVRIYATDAKGHYPIHGTVMRKDGDFAISWSRKGRPVSNYHGDDLVDKPRPPVRREGWVNAYGDILSRLPYPSKILADRGASESRTACIHITWVDGEGLE